jgi:hypothetical protein
MKINAMFVTRESAPTIPELIDAWDEFCIEENPDGYEAAVRSQQSEVGDGDVKAFAIVTFEVPDSPIIDALYPDPVVVPVEVIDVSAAEGGVSR